MARTLLVLGLLACLGLFVWRFRTSSEAPAVHPARDASETAPRGPASSGVVEPERELVRRVEPTPTPQEIEEAVLLRIEARQEIDGKARAAPHVALEVGLQADHGADRSWSRTVETDAEGQVELRVPWDLVAAARGGGAPLFLVRVLTMGFQGRTTTRSLPRQPGPLELLVNLKTGTTLRGRLLDANGAGVRGRLHATLAEEYEVAQSDETGAFEMHFSTAGPCELFARAEGVGSAHLAAVPLSIDPLPEPLDVVLTGPGVLRGTVRDADGNPAAGLELLVLAASLDDEAGRLGNASKERSALEAEGRGLFRVEARTDVAGRFVVTGLRTDLFVVHARTEPGRDYPHRLTYGPRPSDGVPLELVLSRPHLVVLLRDQDHGSHTGVVEIRTVSRASPDAPEAWTEDLTLVVSLGDSHWGTDAETPMFLPGRHVGEGAYVFEVEDDRTYRVGLLGAGLPWAPRVVSVPPGAGGVELVIQVPGRAPTGRLSVDVFDEQGVHLTEEVRIRVLADETGLPLVSKDSFDGETWPQVFVLPVGHYRVEVAGNGWVDEYHGTLLEPRSQGRFEARVEIEESRSHDLEATLPAGARLRLSLAGQADEADLAAMRERGYDEKTAEQYSRRATLHLVAEGLRPEPVWFAEEGRRGESRTNWFELGSEATSQVLSAGCWLLVARLPGGRTCSTPVELVDGETTSVALRFD